MAITAYTGIMGSGKSYEVVENVILPAVASGRRVVTNIAGLQLDEIDAYCRDVLGSQDPGSIVVVDENAVSSPAFFPPAQESIVQGGDVVVLDECWRWFASGDKLRPDHMEFVRMHRHYTAADARSCDLVLIVQSITDLNRSIKVVVEQTFVMSKLKAVGAPTKYRVDVYQGWRVGRGYPPIRQYFRTYRPEIFALYSSYSKSQAVGGGGVEETIDKRGSIFHGRAALALGASIVALFAVGGYGVWSFFVGFKDKGEAQKPPVKSAEQASVPSSRPLVSSPAGAGPNSLDVFGAGTRSQISPWRIVGWYQVGKGRRVVLENCGRVRVVVNPSVVDVDERIEFELDGLKVSEFTGGDCSGRSGGRLVERQGDPAAVRRSSGLVPLSGSGAPGGVTGGGHGNTQGTVYRPGGYPGGAPAGYPVE